MNSYGKIFNFRVPQDKQTIIEEYKHLVIKQLHTDLCYVTTMLIESFVKAHRKTKEPTIINLVQQNITINQNCTNIYGTTLKRSRRTMPSSYLNGEPLPTCELCNNPATRRYFYPHHGYKNLCNNHHHKAPKPYIGYKPLTTTQPPPIVNNCFTLNHSQKGDDLYRVYSSFRWRCVG